MKFSRVAVVGLTTVLVAAPAVASSQRATTPEDIARIARLVPFGCAFRNILARGLPIGAANPQGHGRRLGFPI